MSEAAPTNRRDHQDSSQTFRRRAGDRVPQTGCTSSRRNRAQGLFRKFRQPIIGLGLAGAAFPLVQAQSAQRRETVLPPQPQPLEPAEPVVAARHAQDPEENVVEQIAQSREERKRDQHVTDAVDKYGISREMAEDIYDIAAEEGIEPRLAYGLVKTESTFRERAQSHVGARGLTQVMPRTAAWLIPGTKTEDLYNRQTNLRLGFRYLEKMIDKYRGDVRLALLAYNRGPGTVDKVLKRGGNPDNGYADKVLRG